MRGYSDRAGMSPVIDLDEALSIAAKTGKTIKNKVNWMLSTGYSDRNDKEICEGDFVWMPKRKCGDHFHEESVEEVKWDSNLCALVIMDRGDLDYKDMEVVGNVYENTLE